MEIKKYISNSCPTVDPYEGINLIEDKLLNHQYVSVIDEEGEFYGILTPCDLIKHPHKIVIDCITKKENVSLNDTYQSVLHKFCKSKHPVLPVIDNNKFIGVIEKNSFFNSLENKINELYDKSLVSQETKIRFLNNLSHEIRTPLNSILGFLRIISELNIEELKNNGKRKYDYISKSADRFLLIMNNLIELSRLHAGDEISVKKDEFNIEDIFAELKEYFDVLISLQNKKNELIYINQNNIAHIYSDKEKIKDILFHLIDNAIKFSDDKISYGCRYLNERKHINFFVSNIGSQLNSVEKNKIFEYFEKQDYISSNTNNGFGIGLSIVKKLTEILNGSVKFESNQNETTFYVTIPLDDKYSASI
jgi:signal transduction histidine kinase